MSDPVESVAKAIFNDMFAPHERSKWDTDEWLRERYLDCARAAIAAMPKSEWQPIETARGDGTKILSCREDGLMDVVSWMKDSRELLKNGCWCVSDGLGLNIMIVDGITHWMPLPEPPE